MSNNENFDNTLQGRKFLRKAILVCLFIAGIDAITGNSSDQQQQKQVNKNLDTAIHPTRTNMPELK